MLKKKAKQPHLVSTYMNGTEVLGAPHFTPPALWPNGQPITVIQIIILTLGPMAYYKALEWIRLEVKEAEDELAARRREIRMDRLPPL
jgi:hypothetical protein